MNKQLSTILTIALLAGVYLVTAPAFAAEKKVEKKSSRRIFMFSGKPSAEAWQYMQKNPGDRRAATEKALQKVGCEMLGYYWGLTNARNYIIIAVPDGKTTLAMLIQRLKTPLLLEYEALELIESSGMAAVLERLEELDAADDSL